MQKSLKFKTKFLFVLFITSFLFLVSVSAVSAYQFSMSSPGNKIGVNEQTMVSVYLDTRGESINALEGTVIVPASVKISDISYAQSAISFWLEKPYLNSNKNIYFSGIIPGGFVGDKVPLFSFTVSSGILGDVKLKFNNTKVLLNDGLGTSAKGNAKDYIFLVVSNSTGASVTELIDTELPELFTPIISHDKNIFDDKFFAVFYTQDKRSGIDHYEIAEERWFKRFSYEKLKWSTIESPYILTDQTLSSNLYIKAIDKKGNTRVIWISPVNPPFAYNYEFIFAIMILIGAILFYSLRSHYSAKTKLRSRKKLS